MIRRLTIVALSVLAPLTAEASECTCRALGRDHTVGTTICLATPSGHRLATCDMMLNNTTWRFSNSPCVSADLERSIGPENVAALPQVASEYAAGSSEP